MRIERQLPRPSGPTRPPSAVPGRRFGDLLPPLERFLAGTIDAGRTLERALASRGNRSPHELLLLQAAMYRYAERIELTSRVVDKTAGAVKTVLGTQV
jgi:hypothetical protein